MTLASNVGNRSQSTPIPVSPRTLAIAASNNLRRARSEATFLSHTLTGQPTIHNRVIENPNLSPEALIRNFFRRFPSTSLNQIDGLTGEQIIHSTGRSPSPMQGQRPRSNALVPERDMPFEFRRHHYPSGKPDTLNSNCNCFKYR